MASTHRSQVWRHAFRWRPHIETLEQRRLPALITVDLPGDSNGFGECKPEIPLDCTLRDAIGNAMAGDVVDFDVTGEIMLSNGDLTIQHPMTISGPGAGVLHINGGALGRIFNVVGGDEANPVEISGLTVKNGRSPQGGGLYNQGFLRLLESIVENNEAIAGPCDTSSPFDPCEAGYSGAFGGGIYNVGNILVHQTTVRNNKVTGLHEANPEFPLITFGGGGIYTAGKAEIDYSLIKGNTVCEMIETPLRRAEAVCTWASETSISFYGGGIRSQGELKITNSGVGENALGRLEVALVAEPDTAAKSGAEFTAEGGGIFNDSPDVGPVSTVVVTTTIFNNRVILEGRADEGYAVSAHGGGMVAPRTNADICNATISGNSVQHDVTTETPLSRTMSAGGVWIKWPAEGDVFPDSQCGIDPPPNTKFGIRWSTIAHNSVTSEIGDPEQVPRQQSGGGGVYLAVGANEVELYNSIVANNKVTVPGLASPGNDVRHPITSLGYNLLSDKACGDEPCGFLDSDLLDADFELVALGYKGGPVIGSTFETNKLVVHLLPPNSTALNSGDPDAETKGAPDYDGRGDPYKRIQNSQIDIGAIECQSDCKREPLVPKVQPALAPSPPLPAPSCDVDSSIEQAPIGDSGSMCFDKEFLSAATTGTSSQMNASWRRTAWSAVLESSDDDPLDLDTHGIERWIANDS